MLSQQDEDGNDYPVLKWERKWIAKNGARMNIHKLKALSALLSEKIGGVINLHIHHLEHARTILEQSRTFAFTLTLSTRTF